MGMAFPPFCLVPAFRLGHDVVPPWSNVSCLRENSLWIFDLFWRNPKIQILLMTVMTQMMTQTKIARDSGPQVPCPEEQTCNPLRGKLIRPSTCWISQSGIPVSCLAVGEREGSRGAGGGCHAGFREICRGQSPYSPPWQGVGGAAGLSWRCRGAGSWMGRSGARPSNPTAWTRCAPPPGDPAMVVGLGVGWR